MTLAIMVLIPREESQDRAAARAAAEDATFPSALLRPSVETANATAITSRTS